MYIYKRKYTKDKHIYVYVCLCIYIQENTLRINTYMYMYVYIHIYKRKYTKDKHIATVLPILFKIKIFQNTQLTFARFIISYLWNCNWKSMVTKAVPSLLKKWRSHKYFVWNKLFWRRTLILCLLATCTTDCQLWNNNLLNAHNHIRNRKITATSNQGFILWWFDWTFL